MFPLQIAEKLSHSPGPTVMGLWKQIRSYPGGQTIFSKLLSFLVPYSGSISPRIAELGDGKSLIEMKDIRSIRNHLQSAHAVALMNLGELSTGLALMSALPAKTRAILKSFSCEFIKKGRGTLTARSDLTEEIRTKIKSLKSGATSDTTVIVISEIQDGSGQAVARVNAEWKISLVH